MTDNSPRSCPKRQSPVAGCSQSCPPDLVGFYASDGQVQMYPAHYLFYPMFPCHVFAEGIRERSSEGKQTGTILSPTQFLTRCTRTRRQR